MGLFGGGNSSSSSTTTNTSFDQRVVADTGSIGISGDNTVVNQLDQGAVASALEFARASLTENTKTAAQLVGLAKDTIGATLENVRLSKDLSTASVTALSDGYANAKGLDGQKTLMIVAALIVVGLVVMRKGL